MKKHLQTVVAITLALSLPLVGISVPKQAEAASKLKMNHKKITLKEGQSKTLKITGKKSALKKIKKKKIKWTSNRKKIATVSSKGKVKAKKAGIARITAKVAGKRYFCTVTVKEKSKKTSSAKPTKKPVTTTKPTAPVTTTKPSPTATNKPAESTKPTEEPTQTIDPSIPTPYPENDFIPDAFAKKVTTSTQVLQNHVLVTIKNTNSVWLDNVLLETVLLDKDRYFISSAGMEFDYVAPNETRTMTMTVEEGISDIDFTQSFSNITVNQYGIEGTYTEQKDNVTISEETFDTEMGYVSFNIQNNVETELYGNILCKFYNEQDELIDISTITMSLSANSDDNFYIDIPKTMDEFGNVTYAATRHEISYVANSFEPFDPLDALAKRISAQSTAYEEQIALEVTNNNKAWVSSANVIATFYMLDPESTEGDKLEVMKSESQLASIAPGETQVLLFDAAQEDINSIDFSLTEYSIEVTDDTDKILYGAMTENQVKHILVTDNKEDFTYDITIKNYTKYDVEGTCTMYMYDTYTKNTPFKVVQEAISISPEGETVANIPQPVVEKEVEDEDGAIDYVTENRVKSYTIVIVAHTMAQK